MQILKQDKASEYYDISQWINERKEHDMSRSLNSSTLVLFAILPKSRHTSGIMHKALLCSHSGVKTNMAEMHRIHARREHCLNQNRHSVMLFLISSCHNSIQPALTQKRSQLFAHIGETASRCVLISKGPLHSSERPWMLAMIWTRIRCLAMTPGIKGKAPRPRNI